MSAGALGPAALWRVHHHPRPRWRRPSEWADMIRSRLVLGAFTFDALAAGLAVDDGRLAAVMEPMEVAGEIEAEPMPDGSRLWRLAGARHG